MPRATIFEEHSSVLPHWFAAGVSGATLVYLDAHLDLQFIAPERIERLRECATAAEMSKLESPHPLSPERTACFGIEDFLFAAGRLGLVRTVIWVAPPHVMRVGMAAAIGSLLQMEGVTLGELETFHRTAGGWIEGRLMGVDLVIGGLPQLSGLALQEPVLVDIDTDYFVSVPDDRLWTPPAAVLADLKRWTGQGRELTLARSVGTGFLPLRYRCIADLLAALWEGRESDARHWQEVLDGSLPDEIPSGEDLIRRLGEIRARWKRVDLATVRALHGEVRTFAGTPALQATAWIALGLLYAAFGDCDEAMACDARSLNTSGGHPDLALEVAKLLMGRGAPDAAGPYLDRAAADDETRVAARMLQAECAWARGAHGEAWSHAVAAHTAAPAWPQIAKRLAVFADAMDEPARSRDWRALSLEIGQRASRLASRLI